MVDGAAVNGPVKGVGMAFQNSSLLPWRTTIDNVMLPLEIVQPFKTEMRSRDARSVRARQLLETVGLGKFENHYPLAIVRRDAATRQPLPRDRP